MSLDLFFFLSMLPPLVISSSLVVFSTVYMLIIPTFIYPALTCLFCYRIIFPTACFSCFTSPPWYLKLCHTSYWFSLPHLPTPFLFQLMATPFLNFSSLKPWSHPRLLFSPHSSQNDSVVIMSNHVLSSTKKPSSSFSQKLKWSWWPTQSCSLLTDLSLPTFPFSPFKPYLVACP